MERFIKIVKRPTTLGDSYEKTLEQHVERRLLEKQHVDWKSISEGTKLKCSILAAADRQRKKQLQTASRIKKRHVLLQSQLQLLVKEKVGKLFKSFRQHAISRNLIKEQERKTREEIEKTSALKEEYEKLLKGFGNTTTEKHNEDQNTTNNDIITKLDVTRCEIEDIRKSQRALERTTWVEQREQIIEVSRIVAQIKESQCAMKKEMDRVATLRAEINMLKEQFENITLVREQTYNTAGQQAEKELSSPTTVPHVYPSGKVRLVDVPQATANLGQIDCKVKQIGKLYKQMFKPSGNTVPLKHKKPDKNSGTHFDNCLSAKPDSDPNAKVMPILQSRSQLSVTDSLVLKQVLRPARAALIKDDSSVVKLAPVALIRTLTASNKSGALIKRKRSSSVSLLRTIQALEASKTCFSSSKRAKHVSFNTEQSSQKLPSPSQSLPVQENISPPEAALLSTRTETDPSPVETGNDPSCGANDAREQADAIGCSTLVSTISVDKPEEIQMDKTHSASNSTVNDLKNLKITAQPLQEKETITVETNFPQQDATMEQVVEPMVAEDIVQERPTNEGNALNEDDREQHVASELTMNELSSPERPFLSDSVRANSMISLRSMSPLNLEAPSSSNLDMDTDLSPLGSGSGRPDKENSGGNSDLDFLSHLGPTKTTDSKSKKDDSFNFDNEAGDFDLF